MDILMAIWEFFATNILMQPAYFIGLMVIVGYSLLGKKWYDVLAGGIKGTVGFMILQAGSGGLVSNFRPVLVGLRERFDLTATVIDPYFGQNAVYTGVEEVFGRSFGQAMILLLIAFIVNILLVRFSKFTKMRAVFTTGHIQVQQAATAFWLISFALPQFSQSNFGMLAIMAVLLGLYWAVGSEITIKPTQELTDGANFCIGHQQMFGVAFNSWLAGKMGERDRRRGKKIKKIDELELPGFMSIFNDNMVCTALLMTLFFGVILVILGRDWLVFAGFVGENESFFFYILTTCLNFAVFLAILQLGVRTFVTELTQSFQGISNKLLPGAVPGVDCAVTFGFGAANAVPLGFLAGAAGQFLAIGALILLNSPVLIIAGFVPVFFDNAIIGLYANEKGGLKAALLLPFISGLLQVLGSAFISYWVGMAAFGGYLGMWDWAVLWPLFTVILKFLGIGGVVLIAVFLIAIPQINAKRDKHYDLMTRDWQAYKAAKAADAAAK